MDNMQDSGAVLFAPIGVEDYGLWDDYQDSGPVVFVEQSPPRPLMATSFEDYSVTEGLLLLLALGFVLSVCVKMLKGGFLWLR